jgi:hypothetical protein
VFEEPFADVLGGVLVIWGVFDARLDVFIMLVAGGGKRRSDASKDVVLRLVASCITRTIIHLLLPPIIRWTTSSMYNPSSFQCQTTHPHFHRHFIQLLIMIAIDHQ